MPAAILALLTSAEGQAAFSFLLTMGPKAVSLIEDLTNGNVTADEVAAQWKQANADWTAGKGAWDAAGKP